MFLQRLTLVACDWSLRTSVVPHVWPPYAWRERVCVSHPHLYNVLLTFLGCRKEESDGGISRAGRVSGEGVGTTGNSTRVAIFRCVRVTFSCYRDSWVRLWVVLGFTFVNVTDSQHFWSVPFLLYCDTTHLCPLVLPILLLFSVLPSHFPLHSCRFFCLCQMPINLYSILRVRRFYDTSVSLEYPSIRYMNIDTSDTWII